MAAAVQRKLCVLALQCKSRAHQTACRDKMAAEVRNLEGEKNDLGMELAFLKAKLRQAQNEVETHMSDADALRVRINKATQVCTC